MAWKFAAAAAALLSATLAHAEVAYFEFEGVVTYSNNMGPVGTPITGKFAWDTDLPAFTATPPSNWASYQSPYAMTVTFGSHTVTSDWTSVTVFNDLGGNVGDMIDITGISATIDGTPFPGGYLAIRLASEPGNTAVFRDTSLPHVMLLDRFDNRQYINSANLFDGSPQGVLIGFELTSIRRASPKH